MTPRLAAVLGCAVGVVAGYLGTIVALSVWAWEERANGPTTISLNGMTWSDHDDAILRHVESMRKWGA